MSAKLPRKTNQYAELLNPVGFFEDYFDNKREAVHTFWQVVNTRLAAIAIAA